jgi:hypothetical protein
MSSAVPWYPNAIRLQAQSQSSARIWASPQTTQKSRLYLEESRRGANLGLRTTVIAACAFFQSSLGCARHVPGVVLSALRFVCGGGASRL